jgi:hypothetical protein
LDGAESTPGSIFGLLRRQLYFPHQAQLSAEFQHCLSSEVLRLLTSFLEPARLEGATNNAAIYAFTRGWIIIEGGHSICLTDAGRPWYGDSIRGRA